MHQSHARKVTCHFQNLHGAPVRVILRKVLSIELHPPSCTLKDLFRPPFAALARTMSGLISLLG